MDQNQKSFDRNQYMPPKQQGQETPGTSFVTPPTPSTTPAAASGASSTPSTSGGFDPNNVTVNGGSAGDRKPGKVAFVLGLVVVALVGIAIFAMARNAPNSAAGAGGNGNGPSAQQPERVIPTIDVTQPNLSFAAAAPQVQVGQEVTVSVNANSQGADINGYDLLFAYDKDLFEIVDAKSALDTFQIYQFDRGEYYAITGIKLLNVKEATPFAGGSILEMKIKPKKAGTIYLEVIPERGKETSKFVDKDVKIVKPQLQPIKLEIR
jgi:hypothetical protein